MLLACHRVHGVTHFEAIGGQHGGADTLPGVLAELVDAGLMVTEDGHYLVLTAPPENCSASEQVTEKRQPRLDDFRNRTNAQFTEAQ